MLEAADPDGELNEAELIGVIDRFALQYRPPDGKTVVDRFVASRPDLTAADREMLLGWRDPGAKSARDLANQGQHQAQPG